MAKSTFSSKPAAKPAKAMAASTAKPTSTSSKTEESEKQRARDETQGKQQPSKQASNQKPDTGQPPVTNLKKAETVQQKPDEVQQSRPNDETGPSVSSRN